MDSERGKKSIALFSFDSEKDNLEVKAKEIFQKFNEYFGGITVEDYFLDNCFLSIDSIIAAKLFIEKNESATDYFTRLIDSLEIFLVEENSEGELVKKENEQPIIFQKDYKTFCAILSEISLMLYFYGELFFFPILFREQFDVFMKILDVLEIPMPELPAKSDKRGRMLLYNGLNENITKFAEENNLTPEEACACIYDFAFMLLEEDKNETEMPEPTNIWLTGGSKEDYKTFL
jgi:hypothetical protein